MLFSQLHFDLTYLSTICKLTLERCGLASQLRPATRPLAGMLADLMLRQVWPCPCQIFLSEVFYCFHRLFLVLTRPSACSFSVRLIYLANHVVDGCVSNIRSHNVKF